MNVKELIDYGRKYLPIHEVNMIMNHVLGCNNLDFLIRLDEPVKESDILQCKKLIEMVLNKTPIQYVLGNVNFFGYEFFVNDNVLIPRFETEELVENTINYINKFFDNKDINIIDLGCGSGNIGITLKKKVATSTVTCVDISDKALTVAKKNANKLNEDIIFIHSDMLDNVSGKYNVIISNPPYISRDEEIEDIVKNNEPHLALYADDDGLYFYNKILSTCKKNLEEKFLIAFEIGANQKDKIISLVNSYFDDVVVECKKDMSLKDRMIFIYNR